MKKIKILTISDHPLMTSGVGTQTKIFIESLLKTGKYEFVSLAGAMKHKDFNPVITKEWKEEWKLYPVENFGTKDIVRSHLYSYRPDFIWIMTDPRFWTWLWEMEDEIRANCSLVYYHVWDNYPAPHFNKKYYESNDYIATISQVTSNCVKLVSPNTKESLIPHAVDKNIFKKSQDSDIRSFKVRNFGTEDCEIFLWNNRNARRKQSGTLAFWFEEYARLNKEKNLKLIMHTDPKDPYGTDLEYIIKELNAEDKIIVSKDKVSQKKLAELYSASTATINISDAEGFGLSTLESLSCETPIIACMTGGLQDQITDGYEYFGVPIAPKSKSIIGSQQVPYIYEDRISKEDFFIAMDTWLEKNKEDRRAIGKRARKFVIDNFNIENNALKWDSIFQELLSEKGSWSSRKNNNSWEITSL